jgi:hypothetical protein
MVKADVFNGYPLVQACTGYFDGEKVIEHYPYTA